MSEIKRALVTGITGQDGSYLAEFLLHKGYEVHGIIRRSSTFNTSRIDHIYKDPHLEGVKLFLYNGDLTNAEQISNLIYNIKPHEIYNLAAQSHVKVSFDIPEYTGEIDALGVTRILDTLRKSGIHAKFYQASTSELFGKTSAPQNEDSKFQPMSPYAIAKLYAYFITLNYREAYNLHCSNGILFNHESPRRGETFVTRKITMAIPRIITKEIKNIYMGNLNAKRDWGYAPEYIQAMWKMLQKYPPSDYVIGTGEQHTVMEFLESSFNYVGLDWEDYVKIDPRYIRPAEVEDLCADPSKARREINWSPRINFNQLVKIMVDADMRKAGLIAIGEGDEIIKRKFPEIWWRID